ncbi:hypothetical protein V5T82_05370 [Magnetovibrio sp. PR-2]|uniref:hypothetical protein n=1 Tax=Magnetovibrio sp. PR-2 TaxID=3120356 RepID=UPI002FCE2901
MSIVTDPNYSLGAAQINRSSTTQGQNSQFYKMMEARIETEQKASGLVSSGGKIDIETQMKAISQQREGLLKQSELVVNTFRNNFGKLGMPIIDMFRLTFSNGTFNATAWGQNMKTHEAYPIDHPQEKYIEAAMNGSIPEFAEFAREQKGLLETLNNLQMEMRKLSAASAELHGNTYKGPTGDLFSDAIVFGVDVDPNLLEDARDLARWNPDELDRFKENLGGDLKMMSSKQVLQRYYFETVTKKDMPDIFRQFFDDVEQHKWA